MPSERELLKRVQAEMASVVLKMTGANTEITLIAHGRFSVFSETQEGLEKAIALLKKVPGVKVTGYDSIPGDNAFCAFCLDESEVA